MAGHFRRRWRRASAIFLVALGLGEWLQAGESPHPGFSAAFPNGVASGDVTATSAVLWARATRPGLLTFSYSTQTQHSSLIGVAEVAVVDANQPAKARIEGLLPRTTYYYRVTDAAGERMDGRFRTLAEPGGFGGTRFGVSGDWQGHLAPFVALANVPDRDLDFFVALGDTIYADVTSPAVPHAAARRLEEFRAKHAEVLAERMGRSVLAEIRGTTAIFATVDDHEWTNGLAGGALLKPGEYPAEPPGVQTINQTAFFQAGMQAFLEYQPVVERRYDSPGDSRTHGRIDLYRARRLGRDAALFLLDARSFRDAGLTAPQSLLDTNAWARFESTSLEVDPETGAPLPHRTLLGTTQLAALTRDLLSAEADGVIWKFVFLPEPIQNLGLAGADDRYEGYAAERRELLRLIQMAPIANVVFVSADLHGTLVNQLTYRLLPGGSSQDCGAFEVIAGPAAHDPPFGPSAFDYADGVKITPAVSLLQLLLNLAGVSSRETFNALPLAEKDRRFEGIMNLLLNAVGLDPLGLVGSAVAAKWEIGGPVVVHSYGWTEFEVDRNTHELVVSTHGLPAYSAAERVSGLADPVLQVLNRLRVSPRSVPPAFQARVQPVLDGLLISWRGAAVLETRSAIETSAVWLPASEPVEIDGVDSRVQVQATDQRRFFRVQPRNL